MQKSFSTINPVIQTFHNWLIENNCYHVCMKSTGKYWIPVFNYLENGMDVCLTHPKSCLICWSIPLIPLTKKLELARAAVKSKKQPYFAIKFGQIKKRRGHK